MKRECIEGIDELTENIIEIAWLDQFCMDKGWYRDDVDSIDRKMSVVELAKKYYEDNKNRDYDEDDNYLAEIMTFAEKKLLKEYGRK